MKKLLLFLTLIQLFSSCKTYSDEQLLSFDDKIQNYIQKNKLDLERTESGLYIQILEEGEGVPILYSTEVSFTYKGNLLGGEIFDEQKEPVTFRVDQLIGAWKECMLSLKKGGKAKLIAPPQLGYGDRELDKIPANSILMFDIEVTDVN
jgi:FKBP-type peptidyl-prolyl cis-trans isomerase FkpA